MFCDRNLKVFHNQSNTTSLQASIYFRIKKSIFKEKQNAFKIYKYIEIHETKNNILYC